MHVVLSRPWDDKEIIDVYLVDHPQINGLGIVETFQKDWDNCLQAAKEAEPETWCVDQVIVALEKMGWEIIHLDDETTTKLIHVSY
jgi:hypothetical protein